MNIHDLYKTGDADAPESIKDRNGEVVLGLCRVCGKGEADLTGPCSTFNPNDVKFALTVKKVLDHEHAMIRSGERKAVDLRALNRPGSLVWTDPMTQEERITAPGDAMFSTATMFATHVIDEQGKRRPIYGEEE